LDFQCPVKTINGLLGQWQQTAAAPLERHAGQGNLQGKTTCRTNKKAGARPAFSNQIRVSEDQYFAITGPPQR
jgi:hypothetical protein